MTKKILPALERFINNLRDIWEEFPDDETRMKRAHAVMENGLLKDQELREHCRTWPSTEGRKNLLFYIDLLNLLSDLEANLMRKLLIFSFSFILHILIKFTKNSRMIVHSMIKKMKERNEFLNQPIIEEYRNFDIEFVG